MLTGNPWKNPAATLAAPIPIISWFALTRWPVRAANAEDVEIVSTSATNAMPSAPGMSLRISADRYTWDVEGREPLRQRSHDRHAACHQIERAHRDDGRHHSDQDRGQLRHPALQHQDHDQRRGADRQRGETVSPSITPWTNAFASPIRPFASTENPNSLGSCPTRIVSARPFM